MKRLKSNLGAVAFALVVCLFMVALFTPEKPKPGPANPPAVSQPEISEPDESLPDEPQPAERPQMREDTIYSFLGKPVVLNDSVLEQINVIAKRDSKLSCHDRILQICDVKWGINFSSSGIRLITSVNIDDPKMKQVLRYLNKLYGKPYDDNEDEGIICWSSSADPHDIYKPPCTLVRLRGIHGDDGGTALFFE